MANATPLTDLAFNILIALKDESLHGYALVKHLRGLEARGGLRTGTVYAALARLQDQGLVEEAADKSGASADERRRYYSLTSKGLGAARDEANRLTEVLNLARAKQLLPAGRG
jgi:DNA-binding PadR family transcriptional regulator